MSFLTPFVFRSTSFVPYEQALEQMKEWAEQVIHDSSQVYIWFLEHPSIYTAGASTDVLPQHLPYPLIRTDRGGKITYHGPGQQIVYIVASLKLFENDVKKYVFFLEEWLILSLKSLSIQADRDPRGIGVWVEDAKIASIGIKVRKGVSYHGVSLNVSPDLTAFDSITPCGIPQVRMTSLEDLKRSCSRPFLENLLQRTFISLLNQEKKHVLPCTG